MWEGARKGDISKVREALEEGADVNSRANSKGSTSLHLASAEGHVEVVKMLLEGGADSNLADRCAESKGKVNGSKLKYVADVVGVHLIRLFGQAEWVCAES